MPQSNGRHGNGWRDCVELEAEARRVFEALRRLNVDVRGLGFCPEYNKILICVFDSDCPTTIYHVDRLRDEIHGRIILTDIDSTQYGIAHMLDKRVGLYNVNSLGAASVKAIIWDCQWQFFVAKNKLRVDLLDYLKSRGVNFTNLFERKGY